MFNYPVRGDPDTPRWLGILINPVDIKPQNNSSTPDSDNRIIKLFGRQKYPSSTNYEYYATINMGNDQIKLHLPKHREL